MSEKQKIACVSSGEAFHLLSRSVPEDLGVELARWEKTEEAADHEPLLILFEIRTTSRDLSALKALSRRHPRAQVISFSLSGSVRQAVEALKGGAADYFSLPEEMERLKKLVFRALQEEKNREQRSRFLDRQRSRYDFHQIAGKSPKIQELLRVAERVIQTRVSPVIIRGETGTGKELLARAIHYNSALPGEPFVEVNCGAIPEKLLESELFGHEKGAFTGAVGTKRGLFEVAQNGTLFLDEIDHLTPDLQVKLFNAIEYQTIRRVGGTENIVVNVRIIAATNEDLEEAVAAERIRPDMYYRLNVVSLTVPPLRERGDDVILLAEHFLKRFAETYRAAPKRLTGSAKKALMRHTWPGNVRELKNAIERVVVLYEGDIVDETMFRFGEQRASSPTEPGPLSTITITVPEAGISRSEVEKLVVCEVLRLARGNKSKASRMLGVSRPTLINMMKRHGLT